MRFARGLSRRRIQRDRTDRSHRLRIAVVGNVNQAPLVVAEGLRQLGHDVTVFAFRGGMLHSPYSRLGGRPPRWVDASPVSDDDFRLRTRRWSALLDKVNTHDIAVLNDLGPSLGPSLTVPYVVHLTGSDLTYYGSGDMPTWVSDSWSPSYRQSRPGRAEISSWASLVEAQQAGIAGARAVAFHPIGLDPPSDCALLRLGVSPDRRFVLRPADLSAAAFSPLPTRGDRLQVASFARCDFRRQLHPEFSALDLKGTDVLVEGFARFLRSGGKGDLLIPYKGKDVVAARAYVSFAGIADHVTWMPEQPYLRYLATLARADVVVDSLGPSGPAGVSYDAYAVGRPVVANFRQDVFSGVHSGPYPGLQAESAAAVAEALAELAEGTKLAEDLAARGRLFAEQELSPRINAMRVLDRLA